MEINATVKTHVTPGGGRKSRAGFTLVEVIVVLVILAILAAIAIPALTGYIDKARDKQYIAQARNAAVAIRAVFSEAHADGTLGKGLPNTAVYAGADYLTAGTAAYNTNKHWFSPWTLAMADFGSSGANPPTGVDGNEYFNKARALIGESAVTDHAEQTSWSIIFVGSSTSDIFTADGYYYQYFPEGQASGRPAVVVTYRLTAAESTPTTNTDLQNQVKADTIKYKADEGYHVYANLEIG